MKNTLTPKKTIFCAFFAALTAICSQIAIPMIPVPINLAMFSVFIAGAILGPTFGALSQIIYVLLGAIGIPVFAGFSAGIGIIVGPTGGYIIGYVAAAWLTGFITQKFGIHKLKLITAMICGLILCYALGTIWFMFVTKTNLIGALMACVIPFLIGDSLKILIASLIVQRLISVSSLKEII